MASQGSSYHGFTPEERRRRNSTAYFKKTSFLVLFSLIIAFGGWLSYHATQNKKATTDNPSPSLLQKITKKAQATPTPKPTDTVAMQKAVQAIVDEHPELTLAVSFTNLKDGTSFNINGDQVFTAASTTKMLAAVTYLQEVEAGTYSLDDPLGSYTAQWQLQQLINQSNNNSWDLFNSLVGFSAQEAMAKNIGITSYDSSKNSLSANDMNLLLTKLYKGELLNNQDTNLLYSYMKDTNQEDYIPTALPHATVYHKYGELDDNVNDGAIVEDGSHRYVLAIYTNGHGYLNYSDRAVVIHQIVAAISKLVLN